MTNEIFKNAFCILNQCHVVILTTYQTNLLSTTGNSSRFLVWFNWHKVSRTPTEHFSYLICFFFKWECIDMFWFYSKILRIFNFCQCYELIIYIHTWYIFKKFKHWKLNACLTVFMNMGKIMQIISNTYHLAPAWLDKVVNYGPQIPVIYTQGRLGNQPRDLIYRTFFFMSFKILLN